MTVLIVIPPRGEQIHPVLRDSGKPRLYHSCDVLPASPLTHTLFQSEKGEQTRVGDTPREREQKAHKEGTLLDTHTVRLNREVYRT